MDYDFKLHGLYITVPMQSISRSLPYGKDDPGVLPDQDLHGFRILEIHVAEKKILRFMALDGAPFADPRVQSLWDLIASSPAGSW